MSRIAKNPVVIPEGVEVDISGTLAIVKNAKQSLQITLCEEVSVTKEANQLLFSPKNNSQFAHAMSGTMRALLSNMVIGVEQGFEKKLQLVGVGYRAQVQGDTLSLSLGFSHPVSYKIPQGILISTPSQTEITIKGVDKQRVGQVAAEIRGYRPPEPYKGKGVRYTDEVIVLKEIKKK
jgi:large subunit ribosomal protein L6